MRIRKASMMAPAQSDPDALPRALQRLVQASLPDPAHPRRAPLPFVPMARAMASLQVLTHQGASRPDQATAAALALPSVMFSADAAREATALGAAACQQLLGLCADWVDGLVELGQDMGTLRQVNTVTKYVDEENNLALRGVALVTAQVAAAARLMENVQVNAAWLIGRHATPPAA
ncbi:MAG: hypothetical protein ABJD97_01065 [Betaproteobacteria bacterium]